MVIYTKTADNKIKIAEQKTETRESQYSMQEIDDIIADLETKLSYWQGIKAEAEKLNLE